MKNQWILVVTVLGIMLTSGVGTVHAQVAKNSSASMDEPKVTEPKAGTYKIVVTGTLTLGKDDTFQGFKFWLTDPDDNEVAPIVTKYTQPAPGETTSYSYYVETSTKGQWNCLASLLYKTAGGAPGSIVVEKEA